MIRFAGILVIVLTSSALWTACGAPSTRQISQNSDPPRSPSALFPVAANTTAASAAKIGLEWLHSQPAKINFTKTEVTVSQFKQCVAAGVCKEGNRATNYINKFCNWGYRDRDDHPMNCVDWYGARDFCAWTGGRLPTEDEWYAEASNAGDRDWPWGDNPQIDCDHAVWSGGPSAETRGCGRNSTWPVCSKPQGDSSSGLCDMSGNLWEWTDSKYDSEHDWMAVRGGSWFGVYPSDLNASSREAAGSSYGSSSRGFRCVRSSHLSFRLKAQGGTGS